jgi:hypothetical protein
VPEGVYEQERVMRIRVAAFAILAATFAILAAVCPVSASLPKDEPSSGPRKTYTIEIIACRTPGDIVAILRSSRAVPTDEDVRKYNATRKTQLCSFIDQKELLIIGHRSQVRIGTTDGVIIELEHIVRKERWFVFSSP